MHSIIDCSLLTEDVDILDALMRLTAIVSNKHFIFVRILNNLYLFIVYDKFQLVRHRKWSFCFRQFILTHMSYGLYFCDVFMTLFESWKSHLHEGTFLNFPYKSRTTRGSINDDAIVIIGWTAFKWEANFPFFSRCFQTRVRVRYSDVFTIHCTASDRNICALRHEISVLSALWLTPRNQALVQCKRGRFLLQHVHRNMAGCGGSEQVLWLCEDHGCGHMPVTGPPLGEQ